MSDQTNYLDVPENNDGIPLFFANLFLQEELFIPDAVQQKAQQIFGIKYLFPWQRLVIANILDAVSAKVISKQIEQQIKEQKISQHELSQMIFDQDGNERGKQIVLLPTGAGKSLCFLIPASILSGITLILYPLLALMSDQERRIKEANLPVVVFRGNQTKDQRNANFASLKNGTKIILANPEVLQSEKLLLEIAQYNIQHIAIDEAHCVSEWGDTFRKAYLSLGEIIKQLGNPVVTAFTATASPSVLSRISKILFDGKAHILRSDSDRANIIYHVIKTPAKEKTALLLANQYSKPLIVFCSTRKRTESLARTFSEFFGYDKVKFYHAGLEKKEKCNIENWFYPRTDAILCATCAFGMGVDKKDIKTVIHLDPPPTAESFIQEAGRGGRDSSIANSILLWSYEDKRNSEKFPLNSRQRVLENFAETTNCRRQVLLDALGAEQAVCSGCDNCNKTSLSYSVIENKLYNFIKQNNKCYSESEIVTIFQNILNKELNDNKQSSIWECSDISTIIKSLLAQKKIIINKYPWAKKISVNKKNPKIFSKLHISF